MQRWTRGRGRWRPGSTKDTWLSVRACEDRLARSSGFELDRVDKDPYRERARAGRSIRLGKSWRARPLDIFYGSPAVSRFRDP